VDDHAEETPFGPYHLIELLNAESRDDLVAGLARIAQRVGVGDPDDLANAYQAAGRLVEAIALHERTLTDYERILGADHPDTLASRHNLASAYQAAGRLAEAIPLFERTLTDRERILGAEHPDTLNSRNSLASAYQAAGRPDETIPLGEHKDG